MNGARRFFRRYIVSTVGILALFLAVNGLLILWVFAAGSRERIAETFSIKDLSSHISCENGVWAADGAVSDLLEQQDAWAMILDETGAVVWERNLPENLPRRYTAAEVASFSRWYLEDYPVKVWGREDGCLTVAGFPPGTWVKYYYAVDRIYLDRLLLGVRLLFFVNLGMFLFFLLRNTRRVEKAVTPVLWGIQELAAGRFCRLEERGELGEVKAGLNRAADCLKKKDNTRAEWIRGVSHDIRTPLSMVLGYASELEENEALPPGARKQAGIIRFQGERMRSLVDSLNLTTRLEYALYPLRLERLDPVELGRQAVSGLLNGGLPERYKVEFSWLCPGETAGFTGDRDLLLRMLENLLGNCVAHNPQGCRIVLSVGLEKGRWVFLLSDDGTGMSRERLQAQNRGEDGFVSREGGGGEHGLGLKIVRQIARAHGGTVRLEPADPHGLTVRVELPAEGESR